MKLNLVFLGVEGVQNEESSVRRVGIFSGGEGVSLTLLDPLPPCIN